VRFALELTPRIWERAATPAAGVERLIALVQDAEAAGVERLWLSEDPDGWDSFAVLALLARGTRHILLGPGVTNPYLRHPNLIAASLATLDVVSEGRAFLGLGRGQAEWYREAFGMEIGRPLVRLRETVNLLRQWERPPHVATSEGEIPVRRWRRTLAPLGSRPIYLAATGPRTLALAGESADGVRFNELASAAYLAEAIRTAKRSATEAGRDPESLRFFAHPSVTLTASEAEVEPALERKKATIALIHALPGMERQLATPGFNVEAIMADVRRAMRMEEVLARGGGFPDLREAGDLGAAKRAIPTELVDRVAIVGPEPRVRARLAELAALGVTDCFLDLDRDPTLARLIGTT
jgi:5,10-methylenetetrahydromethanopterin reductase